MNARDANENVLIRVKKKQQKTLTKSHCPALTPWGFPLKSEAEYMPISQTLVLVSTRVR